MQGRPPPIEDASADGAADRAAIERVIADVEAGFNANDPERSVAHFAGNASAVSARGERVSGFDALLEAHRTSLAGHARDQQVR